jgi:hypothetical protein
MTHVSARGGRWLGREGARAGGATWSIGHVVPSTGWRRVIKCGRAGFVGWNLGLGYGPLVYHPR